MKKIIYYSRFIPDVNKGGGCRRVAQLCEVFHDFDLDFITSSKENIRRKGSFFTSIFEELKARRLDSDHFLISGNYSLWERNYRYFVRDLKRISNEWADAIRRSENMDAALIDCPIFFSPSLIKKIKSFGVPVIAVCHNLESLVSGLYAEKKQRALFNKELDILSECDLVITISREEAFVLRNFNINAVFYPYYPANQIAIRMLHIRKKRTFSRITDDIILLGTAKNKPTAQGMANVIQAWKKYGPTHFGGKLLVAGFGTEVLRSISSGRGIEFLGSLANEELEARLSTVKACLCYQENGSGALTRIPEMIVAGIPVLANSHATRSYYNLKGVIEFSNLNDLEQAIQSIKSVEGQIPIPHSPDSTLLKSEISKIIGP